MKRGEIWWAELGPYSVQEQTGRRPVIIWQSDSLRSDEARAVAWRQLRDWGRDALVAPLLRGEGAEATAEA